MARKLPQPKEEAFEKNLQERDIKYLEELLSVNDSQIRSQTDSISQLKNCNAIIEKVLRQKKCQTITEKNEKNSQFYKDTVLPYMGHSSGCRKGKPYDSDEVFPGVMAYRSGEFTVVCPKCALEYIVDNPWCCVEVNLTVDFNFDNY